MVPVLFFHSEGAALGVGLKKMNNRNTLSIILLIVRSVHKQRAALYAGSSTQLKKAQAQSAGQHMN